MKATSAALFWMNALWIRNGHAAQDDHSFNSERGDGPAVDGGETDLCKTVLWSGPSTNVRNPKTTSETRKGSTTGR
jgi:hypothetical protein